MHRTGVIPWSLSRHISTLPLQKSSTRPLNGLIFFFYVRHFLFTILWNFRLGFCPQGGVERGRCTGHDHVQRRAIDEGGFFFVFSSLDLMLRATKVTGVSELVLHLLVVSVVVVLFLWE
jgi:hypothetical protein